MKIEQLIVQHLYNNKKVTLQDIGSFILSSSVAMPSESDKDGVMPENAISFEYNTKATEDASLIDFIVQQTRKIKPLATSDLESYTILGREYLNIGKPFPIEGLGTLQKNQMGHYEFMQGNSVNPKLQAAPALLREKDNEEIVFTTPVRKHANNKAGLIIIGVILLLAIAAALIYFLNKKENEPQLAEQVLTDSATLEKDSIPSSILISDSLARAAIPGDSSTFKVVIILSVLVVYLFFPDWYMKISNTTSGTFVVIVVAVILAILFFSFFPCNNFLFKTAALLFTCNPPGR
jgi:hypothetical protein